MDTGHTLDKHPAPLIRRALPRLALILTLVLTSCGGDPAPTTRATADAPAAAIARLEGLLEAPPEMPDDLRLTFALELKRDIDAEHGEGTFRRALYAAARAFAAEHAGEGHDLTGRQREAFQRVFGRLPAPNDPTFRAFVHESEGVPGTHTPGGTLTAEQRAAAGAVRKVAVLAARQLITWRKELAEQRSDGNGDEAALLAEQIADLEVRLDKLTGHLEAQVATARTSYGALARTLNEETQAAEGASLETLAARTQLLDAALYSDRPVAERIEALKSHPHGAYHYVPKAKHAELITSMERIEEHRKALAKQDEIAGVDGKPSTKRERIYLEAHQSVDAASSVVNLLGATGAIDPETREALDTGLEAASSVITLGTSFLTGDITGVISSGAALLTMMLGVEPPPDPAEVRHEQVMNALIELAKGQQQIMDMVVGLSKQSAAQHHEVMQRLGLLDDLHAIVTSTHRMVAEQRLEGIRDFRQFMDQRKYHAVPQIDAVTGELVRRPALGFENYDAMRRHFERNAKRYARPVRFLNDVTRGEELNILRVMTNPKALEELASDLGMSVKDVKRPLTDAIARRNAAMAFVVKYIVPEMQPVLLGAMARPCRTYAELMDRFESLTDPAAQARYRAQYASLGLREVMERFYNPLLVDEIVEGHLQLRPYELLVARDGTTLRPEAELMTPGRPMLEDLGEDPAARLANFLEPLHKAQALLQKSAAQNAMFSGDVLIPIFAAAALSRGYGPKEVRPWARKGHPTSFDAYRVLVKNATLRDNAIGYQLYASHHVGLERHHRIQDQAIAMIQEGSPEITIRPPLDQAHRKGMTKAARAQGHEAYEHVVGKRNLWPKLEGSDQGGELMMAARGLDLVIGFRAPRTRELEIPKRGTIADPRSTTGWQFIFSDPYNKRDGYRAPLLPIPFPDEIARGVIKFTPYGERLADRQDQLDRRLLAYNLAFGDPSHTQDTHAHLLLRTLTYAATMNAKP